MGLSKPMTDMLMVTKLIAIDRVWYYPWHQRGASDREFSRCRRPSVRYRLRQWQYRQGKGNHVFTCPVEPYIGQPYKTAAHVMKRLCAKAKVKPFGFHAIRHLAATILAQEGKSLFAIQHALRHEKQTTTDRYLHSLGAFSEVSDALSALASRGPANRHILFPAPSSPLSKKESFAGKKEEKQGGEAKAVVVRRNRVRTSGKLIPTGTE